MSTENKISLSTTAAIFCDASYDQDYNIASFGAVIETVDSIIRISKTFPPLLVTGSNQAELCAIICSINYVVKIFPQKKELILFSDSQSVILNLLSMSPHILLRELYSKYFKIKTDNDLKIYPKWIQGRSCAKHNLAHNLSIKALRNLRKKQTISNRQTLTVKNFSPKRGPKHPVQDLLRIQRGIRDNEE